MVDDQLSFVRIDGEEELTMPIDDKKKRRSTNFKKNSVGVQKKTCLLEIDAILLCAKSDNAFHTWEIPFLLVDKLKESLYTRINKKAEEEEVCRII